MITQQQIHEAPYYFDGIILKPLRDNGITAWVAGGSVRDYFMGVEPVDYDLFFPNKNEFQKAVNHFSSFGQPIWESDNGVKFKIGDKVFDLVKKFYKSASDVIKNFDFTVAMFSTDGKNLYGGKTSFKDLDGRNIVIHKVTNADSTLKRVLKYFKKGFKIKSTEVSKLTNEIRNNGYFRNASATDASSGEAMCDAGFTMIDGVCIKDKTTVVPMPVIPGAGTGNSGGTKSVALEKDWIPWILVGMTTLLSIVSEKK